MQSEQMNARRVLVVEDDTMIGVLLSAVLETMGYAVCAIKATEADAVTAVAQYRPDLIIVDAQLGNGSGVSAIETILRTGFVPHLFMSGNVSKVTALRPNAVVLQKPFNEATLTLAMQHALAASS